MKLSVILLDWSVRESFHSINYLNKQDIARSEYELIWVEYYDRRVRELEEYYSNGFLDKYIVLGYQSGDYSKHLAWNASVMEATGDIVILCDSDTMFSHNFIGRVKDFFERNDNSFLLIDEIRNNNKCFWPFSYPEWEEVMTTPGLVNWDNDKKVTTGVKLYNEGIRLPESLFHLNYGSCFCVRKNDYIRFGGLDEHETYTGYICGPYDLVVRMINGGMEEHWHNEEFLLHTYHPWISTGRDRMGPHIRRNSLTSLKHWFDKDIMPYAENSRIRAARKSLYPKKMQERAKVKFTVIVVGAMEKYGTRLYDSISRATEHPFEVVYTGKDSIDLHENNASYVKMDDSNEDMLLDICKNACGEYVILTPSEVLFIDGILDSVLCNSERTLAATYVGTLETYTSGYSWRIRERDGTSFAANIPIIASRTIFAHILDINELLKQAQVADIAAGDSHKEIMAYMWHSDIEKNGNKELTELFDGIVKYNSYLISDSFSEINEVKILVDKIAIIETESPGKFMRYCMWSIGLLEYYKFSGIFRRLEIDEYAILCLELLINFSGLAEECISDNTEEVREIIWLRKLFTDDIRSYLGLACYHIGVYDLKHSNEEAAVANMKKCLDYMPEHREAKAILDSIMSI